MIQKISLLLFIIAFQFYYSVEGIMVKTIDYAIEDQWYKTLGKSTPKISSVNQVFLGQNIFLGVIIWDFETDKKKNTNVVYNIKIWSPSKVLYFTEEGIDALRKKVENKTYLQLGENIINIKFKDKVEYGIYKIEIDILDKISKKTKHLEETVELKNLPKYKSIVVNKEKDFLNFMENYYKNPEPEKAIFNFLYFCKSPLVNKENSFIPVLSFFREIYVKNPYLLNQFLDAYKDVDEKTKVYISLLLYLSIDDKEFDIIFPDKKVIEQLIDTKYPNMYATIVHPVQLDMLWSTFDANGAQKPILKLIQTLDYVKYKGAIDAYKKSAKTQEDKDNAFKDAIYKAVVWSLDSHFKTDVLVLDYAKWILVNENLNEAQKSELATLLKKYQ